MVNLVAKQRPRVYSKAKLRISLFCYLTAQQSVLLAFKKYTQTPSLFHHSYRNRAEAIRASATSIPTLSSFPQIVPW